MAAYAAHLTRTFQGTPSVFQVTAQEALGATVKPALRKFIEYLAIMYPNKCGWCVKWFDELYLVFDCCLQYHYLKHYAASFSERFYGLLRVPTSMSEFHSGQRLPVSLERASLVLLVLAPYLKDKVEGIVEKWIADDDDGLLGKSTPDRARRAAIHVYSTAHLVGSCARLVQLARFVTGRAAAHAPGLACAGLQLRDAPAGAGAGAGGEEPGWPDLVESLRTGDYGSATITFPMLGQLGLRAVEYSAFAVQFLRWWESRGLQATTVLPTPSPPPKDEFAQRMLNRCPICLQTWKIPTVLPVSGYVFCYVCISRYVRARGACPLSGCPAAEASLVRLYLET